jgi:hypothetical protein
MIEIELELKKKLLELHTCTEDFTVTFSGKKCNKVNGLYHRDKHIIIIHNRNFATDEAGDNLLFYTAMHELAHHIQFTERHQKSARAHTELFYSILDDLVDLAESKKLYKTMYVTDEATADLIEEARDISKQLAELETALGKVLLRIHEACNKKGIRYEDVVARKVQISKKTSDLCVKAANMNLPPEIGVDIQEAALAEKNEDTRALMVAAGENGKSVAQVKKSTATTKPVDQEDETTALLKEERRIKRTIESLTHRLEEIEQQLIDRGEDTERDDE